MILDVLRVYFCFNVLLSNKSKRQEEGIQSDSRSQGLGKWQGASTCPPCDALEELLGKRRGGIFDKFQPGKK